MTKITDKEYEQTFQKIESFSKNANERVRYLVQHLNDTRGSSIDTQIQAQTDITFSIMHYEKILEMLRVTGEQLGLKVY